MANLKEIRTRITSVASTMQITSAMKMVSAAKLKRAQDAITQMRPYAEKLQEILVNLSSTLDNSTEGVYSQERDTQKVLLVPIASNRGLCGAFNANVFKRTEKRITELSDFDLQVYPIGKRSVDYFTDKHTLFNSNLEIFNDLNFDSSTIIAQEVMDAFVDGSFDKVEIIYNKFVNAATQELMVEPFLPVQAEESEEVALNADYIFEPSKSSIVLDLIPKSLKVQFYKGLLDSHASEHGARMTAMHKATDNAQDLKDDLTLTYNRQRQASITNEILEIVGGAEALKQ
ncbi:MAG: ATP synthase F1 subunit gamma [Flavobacteriales bacterium]|jgi:F-type H+-transporting ATPase subunit gamma|tara:strand:+ start:360 stop:1220 length:861 start_codon:yes stop_codon:yes gene_type:complete